jgi:uncharacterized alkaline shock family protein YloU
LTDDLQLARAVSEAALTTSGVYSLGTGRYAEAATYGAGEKVSGVVVNPDEVRVHIVARYPLVEPIPALAERVRERVNSRVEGRTTTVVVEDLEMVRDENL